MDTQHHRYRNHLPKSCKAVVVAVYDVGPYPPQRNKDLEQVPWISTSPRSAQGDHSDCAVETRGDGRIYVPVGDDYPGLMRGRLFIGDVDQHGLRSADTETPDQMDDSQPAVCAHFEPCPASTSE